MVAVFAAQDVGHQCRTHKARWNGAARHLGLDDRRISYLSIKTAILHLHIIIWPNDSHYVALLAHEVDQLYTTLWIRSLDQNKALVLCQVLVNILILL